jgi:tellurite resistance protein TerC
MLWFSVAFIVMVLGLLALDLGVFHRRSHEVSTREALRWTAMWVTLGLSFSVFIYFGYQYHWLGLGTQADALDGRLLDGRTAALRYLTGYVVEESLSVDNIFVMSVIFTYFGVPAKYQHRVLFWGVMGALVLRGAMIGLGAALIARFHWILYVFGGFLILTALKMLTMREGENDPGRNPLLRLVRRFFPVTSEFHGERFVIRGEPTPDAPRGRWVLTPLALALVMVETTDLIFAVDSIPAVFAITADPFLVYTSNVFAILGLRSIYFAMASVIAKFHCLKPALAVVLLVVGTKMLAANWLHQVLGAYFNVVLLGVIVLILGTGVVVSILVPPPQRE